MEQKDEKPISKTSAAIIDLLIEIPIFDKVHSSELKLITKFMNFMDFEPKEIVFKEGEKGDYVCFVADGAFRVIKKTESGRQVVIASLTKGRSFGEMAVIDDFPRSATVRAWSKSTLVILTREGFNNILDQHPAIGIKILKRMARLLSMNLRKTSSQLADHLIPLD